MPILDLLDDIVNFHWAACHHRYNTKFYFSSKIMSLFSTPSTLQMEFTHWEYWKFQCESNNFMYTMRYFYIKYFHIWLWYARFEFPVLKCWGNRVKAITILMKFIHFHEFLWDCCTDIYSVDHFILAFFSNLSSAQMYCVVLFVPLYIWYVLVSHVTYSSFSLWWHIIKIAYSYNSYNSVNIFLLFSLLPGSSCHLFRKNYGRWFC